MKNEPNALTSNIVNPEVATTMSSREIAELTGKQHKHVTVDIAKMLLELREDEPSFRRIYFDSMNREQTEYVLDRELTETLLTGYSAELRRKVVRRLRELEEVVAQQTLSLALKEAEPRLLKQVEADYRENLKYSPEHEIGSALISAVKCSDEDGGPIFLAALDGIDFEPAARVRGISVQALKMEALAHISAEGFVGQIQRGEHRHNEAILSVVQLARSVLSARKARADLLEYQKERAKPKLTYQDLLAQDMIHKHDNPYLPVGPAPRKRALRKQPAKKPTK